MKDWTKLVMAIIGCELAGILGTPFTAIAIPTWYATLEKPFFSPPNWLFGPVWTLLYLLMSIAVYLVWKKKGQKKLVRKALILFCVQLFLNAIWTPLFFGLHSPLLGLIDIIVLLLFIVLTMIAFSKVSKLATYILIPYLLWVSFATLLNASLLLLNP